jgi:predicted nucleic acid-binding protein
VDASARPAWLIASPTGRATRITLPVRAEDWLVPIIVQLELAKWLIWEAAKDKADQVAAFTQTCVVVPLDAKIALLAAAICGRHGLAAADAIACASAVDRRPVMPGSAVQERPQGGCVIRYLPDSNIISNVVKPAASASLLAWMEQQIDEDLLIASLMVVEIKRGVLEKPPGRKSVSFCRKTGPFWK